LTDIDSFGVILNVIPSGQTASLRPIMNVCPCTRRDPLRRSVILLGFLRVISAFSLAISLTGCPEYPSAPDRSIRKIILISLDTLRADHLGVYGYSRDTSPRIDEFARRAFVFERALASAPNTPPSQMSMMTSRYPGQHGFTGDGDTMAPSLETLAERLRKAGLQTAGFVDGGYLSSEFGFDRGFEIYDDEGGGLEEILPRALAWLDANGDDPFFLFLHSYDIHAPYLSPPPYGGMFHDEPYTGDLIPTAERMDEIFFAQQTVEPEDMQHLVDSYDEGIRYGDAQIGRLLDHLRSSGRLEDTLVVLTSDHGEEFGEHGSVLHWQLFFQPNLRVPLIIRPPRGIDGPFRVDDQAELIDVLPTLLALVGAEPLAEAQGRSLVEVASYGDWLDATDSRDDYERAAFAWWPNPEMVPMRSIVLDGHQLLFNSRSILGTQLFDLEADPMSRENIVKEKPLLVARMYRLGIRAMQENQPVEGATGNGGETLDPKIRDQLRALGYQR